MTTKTTKRIAGVLSAAALGVLAFIAGCNSDQGQGAQERPANNSATLRRGLGGEPSTLDPGAAGDNFSLEVLNDLYEGLTSESPTGEVVPGAASSWTVDSSAMRYEFNLRPDAKWSNGARLRAQDFVSAWRRVVDPKTAAPGADNLRLIAGAEEIIAGRAVPDSLSVSAPRDDLLIVALARPAPYFPQMLSHPSTFPVYSEASAKSHGSSSWVSNGPYVLSSWNPGANLQLSKNALYWDHDRVRIAKITYFSLPDENAELLRYRAGELDLTQSVPASALAMVRKDMPGELHVTPLLATAYYAFNLKRAPFKDNLALRKAVTMAIDRKALLATILPFGQRPAYGFVPAGTWNYEPQSWDWAEWADAARTEEAQRLYAQAGFSRQAPLHLTLLFNANPGIKQLAIAIASMWKQTLGIDTEMIEEEYRVFLNSRKDFSRWNVVRLGWSADYNDAGNFLDTFRSDSPNDDAGYESKEFDALLDEAEKTADPTQRRNKLEAAERQMLSEYPVIPIFFFSSKRLIKPYVRGAAASPLNRLYSKHLSIDSP
jgi:oligopeptide transport system substrate-binding protein